MGLLRKIFPLASPGARRDRSQKNGPEKAKGEAGEALPPHQKILFEGIFKSVPDALVLADRDRKILMCNPAVTEIFGYEESELLGRPTEILYESRQEFERQGRLRFNMSAEEKSAPYIVNYKHKNGDIFPGETIGTPIKDNSGNTLGFLAIVRDVTNRNQAQELLKIAMESMPEGFAYYDSDDRLAIANRKMMTMYPEIADLYVPGTTFENLLRTGIERGQFPDAAGREDDWFEEKLRYHRNPKGAIEYNLPDGRCIRVEENRTPDGGIVGIRTDITELKRIERDLQKARDELEQRVEERTRELGESEARFRAVVDGSPAGITLKAPGGPFIMVNQTYAKWMGAEPSELEGKTFRDVFPEGIAEKIDTQNRKVYETGEKLFTEGPQLFRDGVTRTILSHKSPVFSDTGEVVAISTVLTDITDRKMAEEGLERRSEDLAVKVKEHLRAEEALRHSEGRLRNIMENIVEGVITIDASGIIESFNPAAEKMFGYDAAEVLGENVSILTDEPDRSNHDGYLQKYHQTGDGKIIGKGSREVQGRRRDGTTFPAELAVSEMEHGARRIFIGTIRDVTGRKAADKALMEAKERAEFANRAKTEFLAHMSHELRTPLNAILGYSDILKGEIFGPLGNEKYLDYVNNISEAGGLLLALLSDILDVSKVEAGELEIEEDEIDIAAAVKDCRTMVLERADLARIGLSMKVADGLPKLFADRRRLKQILLNLLTNAIKFTPEKGQVAIHADLAPDGGIVLCVSDTGIGITQEDIPKILQPFGRVTDAYVVSTPGEGMGLGLSLVNSLIKLHGGRLEIDSTPGDGTRVSIFFPPERTLKTK